MRNRETITVSALNRYVKALLEQDEVLSQVWVEGELSSVKLHAASGHIYMRAVEGGSSVKAVMFRSYASRLRFLPQDGMRVLLNCQVSLYEASGDYQLYVRDMIPMGEGARQQELEQAKQRLQAEGIFAPERKRPLVPFPKRIAVISSSSGAVIRDILTTVSRRDPFAEIVLFPVNVQGVFAVDAICSAIRLLNAHWQHFDVAILARGGGSRDDLWVFNDETLVRTAASLKVPFLSAIGHETDISLLDLAADVRAATPTAAAELAVPDVQGMLAGAAGQLLSMRSQVAASVQDAREQLAYLGRSLMQAGGSYLFAKQQQLDNQQALLRSLSPFSVLRRGYTAASQQGKSVAKAAQLDPSLPLLLTFQDGQARCNIQEVTLNAQEETEL